MKIKIEEIASKKAKDSSGTTFFAGKLDIYWVVWMRDYEDTYSAYFDDETDALAVYGALQYHRDGYDLLDRA